MRSIEHVALPAAALFGAALLLGACAGGTMTASQYPPGYHVGGIDEGAMLATGRQLAITQAPNGTIVTKTATVSDPPAVPSHPFTDGSRATPVAALALGMSGPAHMTAHAHGSRSGSAAASGHGGSGHGGGGGGAGGGGGGGGGGAGGGGK